MKLKLSKVQKEPTIETKEFLEYITDKTPNILNASETGGSHFRRNTIMVCSENVTYLALHRIFPNGAINSGYYT